MIGEESSMLNVKTRRNSKEKPSGLVLKMAENR